jgi:hypothetical protein
MSKAAELANLIGNINAGGGGVNRNILVNGSMNVAQRGTSSTGIASSGYYTCDRWRVIVGGSTAGRFTMTQDSSAPSGFANSLKLDCTTADTSIASTEVLILQQKIEGQNLQGFAKGTSDAKPFAVSFYVKGNASATYVVELMDNDNTRQVSKSFTVGTDWTRVELTFPADTTGAFDDDNAASLDLMIWLHGGSAYTSGTLSETWSSRADNDRAVGISSFFDSTDRTFFITGVQLEVGQNPTTFEHEPFERTLGKCQRYYYLAFDTANDGDTHGPIGTNYTASNARVVFFFPKLMRAVPTFTFSGGIRFYSRSQNDLITDLSLKLGHNKFAQLVSDSIAATTGDANFCYAATANAAKIEFSAEL